jgi:YidC/Oxa1 family membrane protein insertase
VQSRLLLAIVLSAGVLFLWSALFPKPPARKPQGTPPASAPGNGPPAPSPGPAPGPAATPEPPPGPAVPEPPEETFVVRPASGEWAEAGFTTRGGSLRHLTLRGAWEEPERRHLLDLVLPSHADLQTGMVEVEGEGGRLLLERTRTWARDAAAEAASPETDVVFTRDVTPGLRLVKRFVLPSEPGRFDADLSVAAVATSPEWAGKTVTVRLLASAGLARDPQKHAPFGERERLVVHVSGDSKDPVYEPYSLPAKDLDTLARESGAFRLLGVQGQYFALVLWHEGGRDAPRVRRAWGGGLPADPALRDRMLQGLTRFYVEERQRSPAEETALRDRLKGAVDRFHQAWVHLDVAAAKEGEAPRPAGFHLYAGPLDRHVLGSDRYRATLRPLITYPVSFDFLAVLLLGIFDFFDGLLGNAGLAVILMTLVVRGGMMPLSVRNQLSMRRHGRRVQKLKPKLEALKKKHANDRKRFQEEQVKLYREHGVGFPMGCLMLLVQIPVFMALFSSLRVEYGIRHRPFLWVEDLSGPDALVDFGSCIEFLVPGGICGINLIPLLSVALSFWQYRLMPKPTDEQQAQQMKMMKWFPVVFAVLLYNYTAALSIYMVVSSLVAIVESTWVRAKDRHEVEAAAAA